MYVKEFLRVEGLAVFAVATHAFFTLDGPLWLFVALVLAPDLSMAGYLVSPSIGSAAYNAAHTYAVPLAVGVVSFSAGTTVGVLITAVWVAHIGIDRSLTYGLKYPTGFHDTHFDRV